MRRHDYQKEAALRQRAQEQPSHPQVHAELGAWLLRMGRMAQSREVLQGSLGQADRTAHLYHLLGLVFAAGEDYASAERHLLRAAQKEPGRFEVLRDLALVQGAAGRTEASVETLRQAIGIGGEGAEALKGLLRIGDRAMVESGAKPVRRPPQPPRRAAIIERIVRRDPEVAEALVLRRTDPTAEQRETLRAARRALVRLSARHPTYADLYFGLSLVAEQLGEIDRAIEAAEKALAINPRYAEACLLAVRLYERGGQPARASEHCLRATQLRPRWIDAHLRLGHLLREQGRTREAAEAYRGALAVDEKCEEARQRLKVLETALVGGDAEPRSAAASEGGDA